jgi:hypothetical protein
MFLRRILSFSFLVVRRVYRSPRRIKAREQRASGETECRGAESFIDELIQSPKLALRALF